MYYLFCSLNVVYKLNSVPNKPWFLPDNNVSLLKTPWEKEKLLVTGKGEIARNEQFLLFPQ